MKPEIKFNVFVDDYLVHLINNDPEVPQVFLAAMEGVCFLQQYCVIKRALSNPFRRLTAEARKAINVMLVRCPDRKFIDDSKESAVSAAFQKSSRVQFVLKPGRGTEVELAVRFFRKTEKIPTLSLVMVWGSQEGEVVYRGLI